jgi:hypothetical protein
LLIEIACGVEDVHGDGVPGEEEREEKTRGAGADYYYLRGQAWSVEGLEVRKGVVTEETCLVEGSVGR